MKNLLTILLIILPLSAYAWGVVVSSGGVAAAGGGGYATPAYVQSNSGYNGSTCVPALGSNSTTGNTLVVWISGSTTLASTSLSGGGVTTWIAATQITDTGNTYGRFFYGYVTTGGAVSLATTNAPNDPGWSIYEISGIASSSALDDEATAYSADPQTFHGTWTSGDATASNNAACIGAWASETADPGVTWAAGWGNTTFQNSHYHGTAFDSVTAGDYAASGTNTTTTNGVVAILVLKAAEE